MNCAVVTASARSVVIRSRSRVAPGARPSAVKLIQAEDGPVVGIHMVGGHVGELIAEAQLIYNWEAEADDVASLIHPHPTQSEALGEAHLALAGKALHAHS